MKVKDLSEEKEKIIQLWKADERVLALILVRSIMTDKEVLEFCIESKDINSSGPLTWYKFGIEVESQKEFFYVSVNPYVELKDRNENEQSYFFTYKTEESKLQCFRRFLTRVCGNKRIKK